MNAGTLLRDRYTKRQGPVLLTGVQALVRLMLVQADRDAAAGLRTGGFVSGYRGSPLGTLDVAFSAVRDLTDARNIIVKPAVNEEMAATAVAGSQQIDGTPGARVNGVFSLWYGKGPGLDRAADAIRHGHIQGASAQGGVVLAVGDDHAAKSSSIVCCSDEAVAGLQLPLLYPSDAAEIVEYGIHGFAMSRHSGVWTALKIITEAADATHTVLGNEMEIVPVFPDIRPSPGGLHNHWPETPLEQEDRQQNHRLPAVLDYVRLNGLDRAFLRRSSSRIGIVAAGKSWLDLRTALDMLGLDEARLIGLGIALYKPAMIWPLEPQGLRTFAQGLDALIVVEEKGPFLERQIKDTLYGLSGAPSVWGKYGPHGDPLFRSTADLPPELVAAGLAPLLHARSSDDALARASIRMQGLLGVQREHAAAPVVRKPFFCSGCPHNRSTVVPEGSRAYAGIGCHGLAAYHRPRTASFAQMGGEGIHWMGLAPFTDEPHAFANMGDGTYFHSGLLAVRQAVAAKLTITYKLLFNSAVAMTGGQSVDGELSVAAIVQQLRAEGVRTIVVVADEPVRHTGDPSFRSLAARVAHRDDLEGVQRELRETPGVSVLIYDQMCATEKRRLRKRGKLPDPAARQFINPMVCEGCGDCSIKSNCLSVEPIDTKFGVKRQINQSSCNKDYTCVEGFCPSFVTVEGAALRRPPAADVALPPLPAPWAAPVRPHDRILVAGIGGTGVVTIGALLSMSAFLGGQATAVLDQVGMAQRGGAVTSHVHVRRDGDRFGINALRIPPQGADLIIACDQVVANARDVIAAIQPGHTRVIANAEVAITSDFTHNRDAVPDGSLLTRRLMQRAGPDHYVAHPFTRLAERLLGDAIGSNLMMVGFAYQKGWLCLDHDLFDQTIEVNGQAVAMNKAAFAWGRRLAVDPVAVHAIADPLPEKPVAESVDELIAARAKFLLGYQDQAYANRYAATIAKIRAAEAAVSTETALTEIAARALFKLMAYKDEYEVARLYADETFTQALGRQFEGKPKLTFHLAPPLLSRRDKATGEPRKVRFGSWMMVGFKVLVRLRGLRGTRFDPFGYTHERRMERALIEEYEALLHYLAASLKVENLDEAKTKAGLALEIRGYGHIKEQSVKRYRQALTDLSRSVAVNNTTDKKAG